MTALGRRALLRPGSVRLGQLSCASCHDPAHAFGPPNDLPVQLGGTDLTQPGLRAAPSLKYLQAVPQFTEHYFESEDEGDRQHRQWPDRRADLGRARRPRPRSGASAAAVAVRDGQSGRSVAVAAVRRAPRAARAARDFRRRYLRRQRPKPSRPSLRRSRPSNRAPAISTPTAANTTPISPARRRSARRRRAALRSSTTPPRAIARIATAAPAPLTAPPPQFTDFGLIALGVPRNPRDPRQ